MKQNKITESKTFRWKQFNRKSYAVFCSLRKFHIGVLAVSTLVAVPVEKMVAQNREMPAQIKEYELEELEVTGSRAPLKLNEAARMVTVLTREEIQGAPVQSINDLFKYALGVDVRQRGDMGIQTDISIRGGTFDQITLLLNGTHINNPQTGHNAAEFPVNIDDIERIEILEGAASRVYGTAAFTGAINIVTRRPSDNEVAVHLLAGEHGLLGSGSSLYYTRGNLSSHVSGGYNRSDGYMSGTDFTAQRAYYRGLWTTPEVHVAWQFGFTNKDFGSATFYSARYPDQFEHTRRYMVSVQAETQGKFRFIPTVYWTRNEDRFELERGNDRDIPFNYHLSDVYGVNLNSYVVTRMGKTAFGAEMKNEHIVSTTLGNELDDPVEVGQGGYYYTHGVNRTNIGFYGEHNFLLERFSLSVGILANRNTGLDNRFRFYPGIDASYRVTASQKLYASWNMALRMPTFTELYYQDTDIRKGNPHLRPEETQAFEIGYKGEFTGFRPVISAFYYKGKNMIDWIQVPGDEIWYSVNHTRLNNMGVELSGVWEFPELLNRKTILNRLYVGYAYLHQSKDTDPGYKSQYALEYLKHKVIARLEHRIYSKLTAEWAFRWQNRMGSYEKIENKVSLGYRNYPSYALADLRLTWQEKRYQLFAEANNLLNRNYIDLGNIPQPGFWFKAGGTVRFYLP